MITIHFVYCFTEDAFLIVLFYSLQSVIIFWYSNGTLAKGELVMIAIPKTILRISLLFIMLVISFYASASNKVPYDLEKLSGYKSVVPVIVIGSGPAGVTAALYTLRAGYPTIIIEGDQRGGQLMGVRYIENWPGKRKQSGMEIMDDFIEQVKELGVNFVHDAVKKIDLSTWPFKVCTEHNNCLYAMALIVATGGIPKKLKVPGVEEYWGKGIGDCTICEAPFNKGKVVGIVGGGDTAGELARQSAVYARKVIMIVKDEELDASAIVQEHIKNTPNIEVMLNTEITKINGDGNSITDIELINNKTNIKSKMPINAIYFGIGYHPNSDLIKRFVATDQKGFILVNGRSQKTSIPGVFAAGNVVNKEYGKSAVAAGDGARAGIDTIQFLENLGLTIVRAQTFKRQSNSKQSSGIIQSITTLKELEKIVGTTKGLLLVEIYADWCPTCKALAPHVDELPKNHPEITVVKVNQEGHEIIEHYAIDRVPTFLIFKDGTLLEHVKNIKNKKQLEELAQKILTQHA